jgi:hypothetical protein
VFQEVINDAALVYHEGSKPTEALATLSNSESTCSKLQGIRIDLIISPHPNPKERELGFPSAASYGESSN